MAGFDPVLDLLPRAPLAGLDVDAVQKERQHFWERLYQKYEKTSELDQEEISVHDLDNPDTMKRLPGLRCELPTTKAFRRYIAQHGGLLDELTTMAGPPALDEEELSSEDDSDEEGDNDDSEEGEVNVGLGGLVMKDSEEENQMATWRKDGGKRSSEEHLSGETETEEEEDFSSPPAKVVTPSKRRVIVEYYTSEDEEEARDMDPPLREAAETMRLYEGEEENSLICINCGALGDVLEEGGGQSEFRCDECLMKVHPECEDFDCSVCRETAAVVEARWILRNQLEQFSGNSGEEEWVTGVEGDSSTQSSDGTDQENDHYEEQAGWGEEAQDSSGRSEAGESKFDNNEEGEVYGETSGADTTGDGNVYGEDSGDYTTDEGQEDDSLKEGQDMEGGRVVGYLGDSFESSGMGDLSGGVLEENEPPQDSARGMEKKGFFNMEGRLREMSWEEGEEEEDGTEEEDNCSSVSMSTVF